MQLEFVHTVGAHPTPSRSRNMIAQSERARDAYPQRPRATTASDKLITEKVLAFVEANYTTPISLRDVAKALGYSACHLTHTFRENTGIPITSWIIKRRIIAAQRMLAELNTSVASTAQAVGFGDVCYFTRQFVHHVGVTPGRFRSARNGGPTPATVQRPVETKETVV